MNRPGRADLALLGLSCVVIIALICLGNWQMRRLDWKRTLIANVETRAYGPAVAAPEGDAFDPQIHEYQRVETAGHYRHDLSVAVKAVTELGLGFWVMTPLEGEGAPVWINRGFVPWEQDAPADWGRPLAPAPVTGILRLSEPGGTLLERNDPQSGRWVSRDIQALSEAAGLAPARPYFIDAEASPQGADWPRAGMTILSFRNSHLSYALTWYAMALLLAGALIFIVRNRR